MLRKSNSIEASEQFNLAISFIFVFLVGLILPIVLIPVVKITGYSEVVEEISKFLVVLFLILKMPRFKILAAIVFGFLFGFSESVFYLTNVFQIGDYSLIIQRFLFTIPMHIITTLAILLPTLLNKKLIIFGLLASILIHILFNFLI